jgi:hypothetical protein
MAPTLFEVERWGIFEIELEGPSEGNPFIDVELRALFFREHRPVEVNGFYDGEGRYRIRFMPDGEGEWQYTTLSNRPELDGRTGAFRCVAPSAGNHGPVRVRNTYHFGYEDGSAYFPVGTTCYAWAHQGDALEEQTLATLKNALFNKLRMCVFPKDYAYNKNEPQLHAFEGTPNHWDFTRFHPAFFRHLELRIKQLMELGIEADLILFHPYDRWGYSEMPAEADDRYLRYLTARLWAFRNIWWSMANEYDFMKSKTMADWDRFFRIVQENDPAQHLRSVHNGHVFYDHNKPWVTHCSIQSREPELTALWREQYHKPVVVDECSYEGNIQYCWGNIPARIMLHRIWDGFARGGYVGHSETYLHAEDVLWWSKGGVLHGESAPRIAFLRKIWEEGPREGVDPVRINWNHMARVGREPEYILEYFGMYQPAVWDMDLPDGFTYQAELIDPWEMTISPIEGTYSGNCQVRLPGKPYLALRLTKMV